MPSDFCARIQRSQLLLTGIFSPKMLADDVEEDSKCKDDEAVPLSLSNKQL